MTEFVVRRLLIDLEAPIATRWNGNDAFQALPEAQRERFAAEVARSFHPSQHDAALGIAGLHAHAHLSTVV